MSYEDKTLTCQNCGGPFVFSADDQSFHAEKGFTNEPKRFSMVDFYINTINSFHHTDSSLKNQTALHGKMHFQFAHLENWN